MSLETIGIHGHLLRRSPSMLLILMFSACGLAIAQNHWLQPVDPAHENPTSKAAPLQILDFSGFGFSDSYDRVDGLGNPLAKKLGDLNVTVDGVAAPIVFVAKNWLRIQVPNVPAGHVTVVAKRDNGWKAAGSLTIVPSLPEIFDAHRAGQIMLGNYNVPCMAVQNWIYSGGSNPDITQLNCEQPGEPSQDGYIYLVLYGVGMSSPSEPQLELGLVPDGKSISTVRPSAITVAGLPLAPEVLVWHGPAPGRIGQDAYRLKIPANLPRGIRPTPRNIQVRFGNQQLNKYEGGVVM